MGEQSRKGLRLDRGTGSLLLSIATIWNCFGYPAWILAQSTTGQHVQEQPCPAALHVKAEKEAEDIHSWSDLFRYYRAYKHCGFNADAAEEVSESIARLLVDHGNTLNEGAKLARKNRGFREYLLGGVNATLDRKDLEIIRAKSKNCTTVASSFCAEILERASTALEEQK